MAIKFTNNASATLASSISNSATSISLTTGQGAYFPSLSGGDIFYATLVDSSNNLEIIKVTARSTDTLTVVRAQDNTTARAYTAGDKVELRPVAVVMNELVQLSSAQTINGVKTFEANPLITIGYAVNFYNTNYGIGTPNLDGLQIYAPSTDTIRFQTMASGTPTSRATLDASGNFTAVGNVTAYSDERLKDNIQVIPDALNKVKSVRGVTFTRKQDGTAGIGVVAQEILKIAPEAIIVDEDGMLSVAYGNLVGLLIEAVKELNEKVEKLERSI